MNTVIRQKLDKIKLKHSAISRCWDPSGNKEVLDFFVEIVPILMNAERCSIFIHDEANEEVWLQCGTGVSEKQIIVPKSGSNVGEVISTGQYKMYSGEAQRSGVAKVVDSLTGFVTHSMLCVPIKSLTGDDVTGAIQVLNKKGKNSFDDEDRILLEKCANHLEMVIQNIYLTQEMVTISDTLSHKVDLAEWAIKIWMGFLGTILVVAFGIIIYFTPTIIGVFQR